MYIMFYLIELNMWCLCSLTSASMTNVSHLICEHCVLRTNHLSEELIILLNHMSSGKVNLEWYCNKRNFLLLYEASILLEHWGTSSRHIEKYEYTAQPAWHACILCCTTNMYRAAEFSFLSFRSYHYHLSFNIILSWKLLKFT